MMATQSPVVPDLLEDSKHAAAMKTGAPTKDSALSLKKDLNEISESENREPAPTSSSAKIVPKGSKNALLARVQAAQERARLAQEAKKKALAELEKAKLEEERILKGLEDEMKLEDETKRDETKEESTLNSDLFEALNSSAHLSASTPDISPDTQSLPAVAPPAEEKPPSYDDVGQPDEDFSAFQLDSDGNQMSEDEKQRMLNEQKEILEKIQKEKEANDLAIAQLTADGYADTPSPAADTAAASVPDTDGATVEIAPNKRVALHGRGRTEAAIADGSAVLVQCVNCQNWMQVTPSATLMFCPVCQVVSPVQHQNNVHTTEEAVRMSLDRKMAEKMQQEIWQQEREESETEAEAEANNNNDAGVLTKLKSSIWGEGAVLETGRSVDADTKQSWGEYLSSFVSSSEGTASVPDRGSAEIVVGKRPAGAKLAAPRLYDDERKEDGDDDAESSSLLPGRVAESKPMFSCLAEQVSNMISGTPEVPENVHGVDSTSLLSVPDVRRDKDGGGAYASLGSEDKL